ncbi:hypothetical protein HOLleu_39792 [Holothuria leucospilota]|uniref:Uncharacterized protein n=1 Tax=Holothuria leucospilota TaxID=206669 RepID=A0A9Q0YHE4_HOLLE|nr:hypothetical protein HOLleu_39792 [Holothuria leucospilota]
MSHHLQVTTRSVWEIGGMAMHCLSQLKNRMQNYDGHWKTGHHLCHLKGRFLWDNGGQEMDTMQLDYIGLYHASTAVYFNTYTGNRNIYQGASTKYFVC